MRIVENFANHVDRSRKLKSTPDEDKEHLKDFIHIFQKSIIPMLLNLLMQTASDKCYKDAMYTYENLASFNWATKMLDSYGKPESGILLGNLNWIGEYDECVNAYAPQKENTSIGGFHGKYCTMQIPFQFGNKSMPISTAVCLPDTCNPSTHPFNISGGSNSTNSSFIEELYSVLNNSTLTCKRTSREYTTSAVVVICLLSFFAVLAFIGSSITALEYWMNISPSTESVYGNSISERAMINGEAYSLSNKKSDDVLFINKANALPEWLEKCKPFFNCFCIFTNGEKILNTTSSEGQLPCLHGIRFLSMSWVILCHTYTMLPVSIRNKTVFADILNHWIFEVVLSGGFAVDSFFVLSGFLVAYLYFKQCSKNGGKIPWLYFYVHRYIRLTPVYMIVLAYFTTLYTYSNSGPLWPDYDVDANCKTGWWWNLLYISNFQSEKTHCMSWSWYLANDMQFYIISPLLLISLWRWPKIGYSLMGLIFAISFSAYFAITYKYDYDVTIESIAAKGSVNFQGMMDKFTDFTNKTYTKPYTRISPYLVGILLAYFLHRRKQNDSPKLNTITLSVGWIVASSITLACVFGLYNRQQTLIEACFYNSLSRTCFACGIAWVVFVCVADQGGIVNSILSWEVWIPLSRLTYCAYLVHPMVLQYAFLSIRKMFEYSLITMILHVLGLQFLSYLVALITSLLFESPIVRLEKIIRTQFKSS